MGRCTLCLLLSLSEPCSAWTCSLWLAGSQELKVSSFGQEVENSPGLQGSLDSLTSTSCIDRAPKIKLDAFFRMFEDPVGGSRKPYSSGMRWWGPFSRMLSRCRGTQAPFPPGNRQPRRWWNMSSGSMVFLWMWSLTEDHSLSPGSGKSTVDRTGPQWVFPQVFTQRPTVSPNEPTRTLSELFTAWRPEINNYRGLNIPTTPCR